MAPVSASKAKRQADKAAKSASKKGTPKDSESTAVDSSAGGTVVGEDGDVVHDMKKLALATDRCVHRLCARDRSG
jgi:hypothetical protein